MAEIFPRLSEQELDNLSSYGEAQIYRALRDIDFPGLVIHHSLDTQFSNKQGNWVGEADFVLFHKDYGFQLWEVKGGGIELKEDNNWYSHNRRGANKISNPLGQLKKLTSSFVDKLKQELGNTLIPFAPVLAFPNTRTFERQLPLAVNRLHLVLQDDLEKLDQRRLIRMFQNAAHGGPDAKNSLPLSKEQAALIKHRILQPTFSLVPTLADRAQQITDQLIKLNHDQSWALKLLDFVPRMTVMGGAGTGKSLLARERAKQLAMEGKKVLLLCFNKRLAEQMSDTLKEHDLQEGLHVFPFHGLCESLCSKAGIPWEVPSESPAEFFNDTAPDLLVDAFAKLHERGEEPYDALIVDESQDFEPHWWIALSSLLNESASVALFADEAQNLFQRDFSIPDDVFSGMIDKPFILRNNCRNCFEIADWIKKRHLYAADPSDALPSSNKGVQIKKWKQVGEQTEQAQQALLEVAKLGFKTDDILLLSPYQPSKSATMQACFNLLPELEKRAGSISATKGLQAKVVFLFDMKSGDWASKPELEYVGASRAETLLYLFEKN